MLSIQFFYCQFSFSEMPTGSLNVVPTCMLVDIFFCYCSVTQSCLTVCDPMEYSMPDFPVIHHLPGDYSNSCPLSWWYHPIILSSVVPLYILWKYIKERENNEGRWMSGQLSFVCDLRELFTKLDDSIQNLEKCFLNVLFYSKYRHNTWVKSAWFTFYYLHKLDSQKSCKPNPGL